MDTYCLSLIGYIGICLMDTSGKNDLEKVVVYSISHVIFFAAYGCVYIHIHTGQMEAKKTLP